MYAGPDCNFHFKYSSIVLQVTVSFMYGMILPILFPIALFGLFNAYVTQRICFAYYYKRPPMYDGAIHKQAIAILKWAPVPMFLFGYWAFGQQ